MKYILATDVSEYQAINLPWPAWAAFGVQLAIVRVSIGYRADPNRVTHLARSSDAGLKTAIYHALLDHNSDDASDTRPRLTYSPVQQATTFVGLIPDPSYLTPLKFGRLSVPRLWVDVEAPDINASKLQAFLRTVETLRPGACIGIYTSMYFWQMWNRTGLIGKGHTEFSKYPFWIADYTNNPPLLPDICECTVIHQFRSKAGFLPGYSKDLDVDRIWVPELTLDEALVEAATSLLASTESIARAMELLTNGQA